LKDADERTKRTDYEVTDWYFSKRDLSKQS
jgi:hypothetical protein